MQIPSGRIIRLDDTLHFTVSGILQDLPANTDFRREIYLPFTNLKDHSPWLTEEGWWLSVNEAMQCYALMKPGISADMVNNKVLARISDAFYDKENAKYFRFRLQPLSDIHFNPNLSGFIEKKNLWALSLIGLLLIVSTCINFVNLTIAQAVSRSREIGVRKVLGSLRRQLFMLFITETALITLLAMAGAILLACLSLPYLNRLFDMQLGLNMFSDLQLPGFLCLLFLLVVLLSGVYPGLIIAGFQPVQALKNKLSQQYIAGFSFRRGLVITQFVIAQLLIISTIVIARQMQYTRRADLGFQKEAIVMLPLPDREAAKLSTLRSQLTALTGVEKVTFCNNAPASERAPSTGILYDTRAEREKFSISFKAGDPEYISAFGLTLLAGRNLHPSDTIREYLM